MRSGTMYVFISAFMAIFGVLNYYIGFRGWQTFGSYLPGPYRKVYWIIFWLLAMSYLMARIGRAYLPIAVDRGLTLIGSFWLGAMFYFILILAVVDVVRLLDRWLGFLPPGIKNNPTAKPVVGLVVFLGVCVILAYGFWNARHPQIRHYNLSIPKQAGILSGLHIVMVSDIHLGTIIHNGQLVRMTDMIKELKPDIVLFAGDIIDVNIETFVEQQMADSFKQLKPKYGVFAVLGNHEYIGGHSEEIIRYLQEAGVQVLRDRYVKVNESIYVVGRDDRSGERFNGRSRQKLSALMRGIDHSFPIILMDHQPANLKEGQEQGADLQFSGHTHRGQMFPNQFITRLIYEEDWGYLKKGSLQVIVSSGYGTWGPPIRIGNTPEIVDISVKFTK